MTKRAELVQRYLDDGLPQSEAELAADLELGDREGDVVSVDDDTERLPAPSLLVDPAADIPPREPDIP